MSCSGVMQESLKGKIDKNIQSFNTTKLQHLSTIDSIAFEWQPNRNINTLGYVIYRNISNPNKPKSKKMKKIANLKDKYISHFVDTKLKPDTTYIYSFSILGKNGMESYPSMDMPFSTKRRLDSVSFISGISNLPHKAKIIWRPHSREIVNSYNIYKKKSNETKFIKISNVKYNLSAEFIDINLPSNSKNFYFIKGLTYSGVETKSSKAVEVITKKIPKGIIRVSASKNLPKKINISWEYEKLDVSKFNIYTSSSYNSKFNLIASTKNKTYSHIVKSGVSVFYKISAIDKDNLEGNINEVSAVIGSSLNKPNPPSIETVYLKNNKVYLKWVSDNRATSYIVLRDNKKIANHIKDTFFVDIDIKYGVIYEYKVISIDKYNISSLPSPIRKIKSPRLSKK